MADPKVIDPTEVLLHGLPEGVGGTDLQFGGYGVDGLVHDDFNDGVLGAADEEKN